ncbi:nucleolin-like [Anopheles bellator]|uniref:nucleolin-like n=1 Tax=Anopheles bellator TaxID=139047 RepID=UPI002649DF17|nr:nucleolin-like [Anopheles bellator]
MSRRKQAKPRALKHEGDDENAAEDDGGAAAECEVKSAMDTSDDEDADRCQPDEEEDDERSGDEFVLDEASRTSGRDDSVNDRGVMSESDRKKEAVVGPCAMASSAETNGQPEPPGPTDNEVGESHCPGPTARLEYADGPDGVDGIKSEGRFERDSIHSGEFADDAEDGGEDDESDDDEDLDDEDIDDEMDDEELLTAGPDDDDDELTSDSFCSVGQPIHQNLLHIVPGYSGPSTPAATWLR